MTDTYTTTENTDRDRFIKESNAATAMRLEISYITGLSSDPEISRRLEKALDKHKQERDQSWF
tara:strand:- start:83 stop:271 length:189 start_codon:yes stop_codon:yes gene_type:complete